jgi:uncharacterized protein YndB with AHSA1/START domain
MNKPLNLVPPVQKSIRIARAQADVFRFYTEHYGKWWPLKTHSIGGEKAINAVMEPGKGGRLYEVWSDGSIKPYGEVRVWEPPHRVVHSWHVGHPPGEASEVELRFIALSANETQVELEHRNWETMSGDKAAEVRERYNYGWNAVFIDRFGSYAATAEA